jgi:hypothetical protein
MSRYTCIRYIPPGGDDDTDGRDIYLEEPVPTQSFHKTRVDVLHDGMRPDELPEDACPICVDDLPQGAWNDYVDPADNEDSREGDDFRERSYPRLAPR